MNYFKKTHLNYMRTLVDNQLMLLNLLETFTARLALDKVVNDDRLEITGKELSIIADGIKEAFNEADNIAMLLDNCENEDELKNVFNDELGMGEA
ncbi:MAG: hypothetical protein MR008_04500 [Aerococcus sp.]|nr:hypothetical protein [Aerococcus sp.]